MATATSSNFKTEFQIWQSAKTFTFPGLLYEPPINAIVVLNDDEYRIMDGGPRDVFKNEGLIRKFYVVRLDNSW